MSQSRNRIVKAAAAIEATVGTNPNIDPANEGFFLFTNANPVGLDTQTVILDVLRESYTPSAALIGRQLINFTPTLLVQGSGAAGTAVRFNALLRCCGLKETVAASSVVYDPAFQDTDVKTASIELGLDGVLWETNAAQGTFTISASAAQGMEIAFNIRGLYNEPVNVGATLDGWSGGTNRAVTWKGANLIINNGTVAWSSSNPSGNELVIKSMQFDRGVTIGERSDANATDGLAGLNLEAAEPTFQVVVEAKNTVTGLPTLFSDLTNSVKHNVTFDMGSGAGNTWSFSLPKAQLTNVTPADGDGGTRVYTLDYRVQHDTDGAEFKITTK